MENNIEENVLIEVAMNIILHAGDARNDVESALNLVKEKNFASAKEMIKQAKENIRLAHQSQTEIIQNETRGIKYEQCLLFTHAQDTLMTINSEGKLANQIIELFEAFFN